MNFQGDGKYLFSIFPNAVGLQNSNIRSELGKGKGRGDLPGMIASSIRDCLPIQVCVSTQLPEQVCGVHAIGSGENEKPCPLALLAEWLQLPFFSLFFPWSWIWELILKGARHLGSCHVLF